MPHNLRRSPPPHLSCFCAGSACLLRKVRQSAMPTRKNASYICQRTRGQTHPHLLPGTNESGTRHERIWDEIRVCTGRRSPTGIGEELTTRRNGGVPPAISKRLSQQTFFPNDTTRTNQRNKKEPTRRHERPREPVDARKRTGL